MSPIRPIRLIAAPIRGIVRSRLFQLIAVLAIVLLLDHYSFDYAPLHQISAALKTLVDATAQFSSQLFRVGILTDPVLQVGLIIAYVYLVCLLIAYILRAVIRRAVNLAGRHNFLWLRNPIARERGITAYRAWEPLEEIRPAHIPQSRWEETFAWPANDRPPYPPLAQQIVSGLLLYLIVIAAIAIALQIFTPFPVLSWLDRLIGVGGL
jgi:small-conductance mechanosensitive channel